MSIYWGDGVVETYTGDIGCVVRCALHIRRTKVVWIFDLIGAWDGGDQIHFSGVARDSGAFSGHVGEVTALGMGVGRCHDCYFY